MTGDCNDVAGFIGEYKWIQAKARRRETNGSAKNLDLDVVLDLVLEVVLGPLSFLRKIHKNCWF